MQLLGQKKVKINCKENKNVYPTDIQMELGQT